MASSTGEADRGGADLAAQIRRLREDLDRLLRDRVTPGFEDAAARMEDTAKRVRAAAGEGSEALADAVRRNPIAAVLVAAAVGFLLGRATR